MERTKLHLPQNRARPLKSFRILLTSLLALSLLTAMASSPLLTPTANSVASACSTMAINGNNLKAVPSQAPIFYMDSSQGVNAAYLGYQIQNSSATALTNVWVSVDSFTGGKISLANPADQHQSLSSVPAGSVSVSGSANKVTLITSTLSPTTATLGGTYTVTVTGDTGKVGAGSNPDTDLIWVSPAAFSTWPTRALRLESTTLTLDCNNPNTDIVLTNTLSLFIAYHELLYKQW